MRLILLLFVSLGPALAQGGPIWVELKASASSGAGALTLGDIAEVDALDSKVAARLRRLVIGQVDTLPARLEVARVRKQLETSGYEASSLRFSGAKSVAFEKRELRIAAEEVEAAARRHLKRRMSAGVSTVELAGQIEDLHLPAPRYRVRSHVLADPSNPGLVGLVNLIYVVELDGRERARIRVPFRIQREMDVVVATRRIAAGRLLERDDLKLERRRLGQLAGSGYRSIEELIGHSAAAPIAEGQALASGLLRAPPVINRGDVVQARFKQGGMTLQTYCRARESGAPGDRILLENVESKKRIYAVIVDAKTVEVRH